MLGKAAPVTLGVLVTVVSAASANTIEVRDDRPNAIQAAINDAEGGDRLRIHDGRYGEDVDVDKRLKLVGVGGRPVINGGCDASIVVDLDHRGVVLRHLKVVGALQSYSVDVRGLAMATLGDLVVKETCGGGNAAFYGINVYQSKAIEIRDSRTFGGFRDAGIYVGDITDTSPGPLIVAGNETYGNNRGIIVEDSFGVRMRVRNNSVHGNDLPFGPGLAAPTGIFSHNSSGIRYVDNRIRGSGQYGIHLDAGSDDNLFFGNRFAHNPDPLFDQGSGNCGFGNIPEAFDPC